MIVTWWLYTVCPAVWLLLDDNLGRCTAYVRLVAMVSFDFPRVFVALPVPVRFATYVPSIFPATGKIHGRISCPVGIPIYRI